MPRKKTAPSKAPLRRSTMTAKDFAAWMERHHLDYKSAAAALGMGNAAIYNYRNGTRRIPEVVAILCTAYDDGFRGPYPEKE